MLPPLLSSLVLFGEGLLTGITLTAMLGPVTMMILRYGLQVNRVAGVWTATGTWVSDFVFIGITYWMTSAISAWTESPDNRFWIYLTGGIGLLMMGLFLMRAKSSPNITSVMLSARSYAQAFLAGFLVNSLSPFTFFFWIGAAIFLRMQEGNHVWYYIGLMITLGVGDFLKAWLAPKLHYVIKGRYIFWVQVIAGVVIALSGVYVIGMGIYERV